MRTSGAVRLGKLPSPRGEGKNRFRKGQTKRICNAGRGQDARATSEGL